MPVRFVIGRAGTGKTHYCLETARQESRRLGLRARVFMLLPPQGTFMAERELACGHDAVALAGVQVVSFESLVRELAGQDTRLIVSAQGRRLVLSHLLRQHETDLQHFTRCAAQPHLAARIDAALNELEAGGVTFEQLEAEFIAAGQLSDPVARKLHDLRLLHDAWQHFLGQDRIDPAKRLQEAAQRIAQHEAMQGATVLVDGFIRFSAAQRQLLATMARVCQRMEIGLLMDPQSPVLVAPPAHPAMGLFHRGDAAYLKLREAFLKEGVAVERPLLLTRQYRTAKSPALSHLESNWPGRSSAMDGEAVQLIEAGSPRQEVELAARTIRQWQREGIRLRDIGVFARSLEDYHGWVGAIFAEYAIPCFIDRRRPMSHHALLRLVRGLLAILRSGWRQEPVIELLKCGLLPLSGDEADRLENFALLHGIDRQKWVQEEPWLFTTRPVCEDQEPDLRQHAEIEESRRCDALRRTALAPIHAFVARLSSGPHTIRDLVGQLYTLLASKELGIRDRLFTWIVAAQNRSPRTAADLALAAEHQQAWSRLMALLQETAELLGDSPMDARAFAASLEAAMEGFDLAITPPTLDQVLVGQIDRSRSPEFRRVIVLGLSDGLFPARPTEDPIFSDAERQTLLARGVELNQDALRQILDERLLGYLAFTRASEKLVLSRHTHTEGGAQLPASPFLAEVLRLVRPTACDPMDTPWSASIATLDQAAEQLAQTLRLAWHRHASDLPPDAEALYGWLLAAHGNHPAFGAAGHGLRYRNDASLSPELVKRLFPAELHSSVSRLEAFAACPFKHFAGSTLRLHKREVAQLASPDLGNVFHNVLERLVRRFVQDKLHWDDPKLDELIPSIVQEVGQALRGQLMLSTQRNRFLLDHIEKTVRQIVSDQQLMRQNGCRLSPREVELSFGPAGNIPALEIQTPQRHTLLLQGRIDRVDLLEDQVSAAVFDYKLRGKSLKLDEVYHGLALQLLTYMLVLREHGIGRGSLTPVGAFYQQLLRTLPRVKDELEADEPDEKLDPQPRGLMDVRAAKEIAGDGDLQLFATPVNKEGQPRFDNGDLASPQHMEALLERVESLLGQMADQVFEGEIRIRPYMLGRKSPCSWCDYRSVCRFEPSVSGYNILTPMRRKAVLETLLGGEVPHA